MPTNLSILIPTITERHKQFTDLCNYIYSLRPDANIVYCCDDREMSIGSKRQLLLDKCKTEYMMMLDDDDSIPPYYFDEIEKALSTNPDVVGYYEQVGNKRAIHSSKFTSWGEKQHGYDYVRTIFYKDVIRTELAKLTGFSDMRYGEDRDFADRLAKHIKTEVFIDKVMYIYNEPKPLSKAEHNIRYGIKS